MKNYAITSGSFTSNGNYTGYNALGERLFIHKRQMESLGWSKNEQVKFPFYVIGGTKMIGQLDENGTPKTNADGSPVLVERLQAFSVFADKAALTQAHVDNATLDIEIKGAVAAEAKKAGLTEKAVETLLNAVI